MRLDLGIAEWAILIGFAGGVIGAWIHVLIRLERKRTRLDDHDKRFELVEAEIRKVCESAEAHRTVLSSHQTDIAVLQATIQEIRSSMSRIEGMLSAMVQGDSSRPSSRRRTPQ